MKRKHISSKKVRIKRGGSWINGNCFVKRITHFKFKDLTLDDFQIIRFNRMSNSLYGSNLIMTMKGVNKSKREKGEKSPFSSTYLM